MLKTRALPAGLLSCGISIMLILASSSQLLGQSNSVSGRDATGLASSSTIGQSDAEAILAMQNVIEKSGGMEVWKALRSAKETFSILSTGEAAPQVISFLNDWSLDTTRYRRKIGGQNNTPSDHNGSPTFAANNGTSQVVVPEFDQAKTLVGLLPAAAAEVMLRRAEYVLKISKTQICKSGDTCVDVYRTSNHALLSLKPDQQWKISGSTGLPITVRYQTTTIEPIPTPIWREVYFVRYATEGNLFVPVSLGMSLSGKRQTWTFVSLEKNPGFDTAKFDQEAAQ